MSKLLKNIIWIVSIMIIIVLICIVILKIIDTEKTITIEKEEIDIAETIKVGDTRVVEMQSKYIKTNEILGEIFDYISEKEKKVNNSEALISILDQEYKVLNNITVENVTTVLQKFKNISSFFTKEIYTKEVLHRQNINGQYLYVKVSIRENQEEKDMYLLIKEDLLNNTYSINFIDATEYINKEKAKGEINIVPNDYNTIIERRISDKQICIEFLNDYFNVIKNNVEQGYKLLDQEYRIKRFGNIEKYKEYINEVQNRVSGAILREYLVDIEDDCRRYICIDQLGNYYIFTTKQMMNYTVMLDSYTVSIDKIEEKYMNSNTMERVGYNIQRVIEAINNKDYSFVYNRLDKEFKNNNYESEEVFIKTIKENLFNTNIIDFYSNQNEGNIYIYNITVSDLDKKENKREMSIIMKLEEDTNFVMSFSFN